MGLPISCGRPGWQHCRLPTKSDKSRRGGQGIFPQGASNPKAGTSQHHLGWLRCITPSRARDAVKGGVNVWSAAFPQAKNAGGRLVCANVYGLYWRVFLRAMMECAALCSSLSRQSCEDFFTPQVSRAPGSTVEPSHCSPADLAENQKLRSSSRWAVDVGIAHAISKPGFSQASSCAVHVRQFEGASPLSNLMEVKD